VVATTLDWWSCLFDEMLKNGRVFLKWLGKCCVGYREVKDGGSEFELMNTDCSEVLREGGGSVLLMSIWS